MSVDLSVQLNRLALRNPILVASGTFGYAREMAAFVDFTKLGGVVPKTVTRKPRTGNKPPRTVETSGGMLNSIGLDNDGIDYFLENHVPYLAGLGTTFIANIAGRTVDDFAKMAGRLGERGRTTDQPGIDAVELNVSCPNVSGGVDFGTNPERTAEVVRAVRDSCDLPVIAKLTPNVADVRPIAAAAAEAGADAVSLINTLQGMAVDWRMRRPILGANLGGLSGPAIKPVALRIVWQVAQAVDVPIIGIGGIATIDDVMQFLVAGASAVQIGTANFYNPSVANTLVDELATAVGELDAKTVPEIVGTLRANDPH